MADTTPLSFLAGDALPPGTAVCLRRCGWTPPTDTDAVEAATAHRDTTGHPTLSRRAYLIHTQQPSLVASWKPVPW